MKLRLYYSYTICIYIYKKIQESLILIAKYKISNTQYILIFISLRAYTYIKYHNKSIIEICNKVSYILYFSNSTLSSSYFNVFTLKKVLFYHLSYRRWLFTIWIIKSILKEIILKKKILNTHKNNNIISEI